MSLLPNGYNPLTLEDVFNQQAKSGTANIQDQYSQARKRLVAQQAAGGRLMSGVADYPLTDLDTSEGQALSGVQDRLAGSLAGIPAEDWLYAKQFGRQRNLANQIGNLNRPSTLDEVFQGIGSVGPTAAMFAAMA